MGTFGEDLRLPNRDFEARLRRFLMRTKVRVVSDVDLVVGRQRRVEVEAGGARLLQVETIMPGGVMASVRPVCREAYPFVLASCLVWGVPLSSYRDLEGPGGEEYRDLTCLWHQSGSQELAVRLFLQHFERGFASSEALTLEDLVEVSRTVLYSRMP